MKSSRTTLSLGILAGAALAALAASKIGRDSLKKLTERVAEMRTSVTDQVGNLKNQKGYGQHFI